MTRTDRLYMDNLSEFIFDDKKVVTFKFLSCTLGVHVNIAKQMLFHFHNANKNANKRAYATYYVSGTAPQGTITDPSYTSERKTGQPVNSVGYGYIVALCKEQDLDAFKNKFTKIHSVHIYALSAFPLDNMDILRKAMRDPVYQERNPVDFGSISCKAALEVRENRRTDLPSPNIETVKFQSLKSVNKEEEKSDSASTTFFTSSSAEKLNPTNGSIHKKSVSEGKKPANQNDNRLKNMFATAASKPKEKKKIEEKMEIEDVSTISSIDCNSPKQSSKTNRASKKKEKTVVTRGNHNDAHSRKRKRIKDVLSSSSEEDEKASEDEEYGLPESPVPRSRNLIESDSDEDVVTEVPKKSRVEDAVEQQPGRRKVSKTVSKTYMDKDGFLVTAKEQVMVSEPETSDTETVQSSKNDSAAATILIGSESKKATEKNSEEKVSDKKSSKIVKPVSTTTKSKQSSLMSFFQKK